MAHTIKMNKERADFWLRELMKLTPEEAATLIEIERNKKSSSSTDVAPLNE